MERETAGPPGLVGSLRMLGDSLLATLQDRLELFALELEQEKFRLIQTFVWISVAVFSGMMAICFASLTLVYLFWEQARLAVLGGLTVFYAAALAVILLAFRRFIARQARPFAATRQEIGADRACIRSAS
jgi:uncharacterized membrane protein YqjE